MPTAAPLREPLTLRQIEVIALAANGLTADEIAARLMISPNTVEVTLRDARRRAGARNTAHLVALAVVAKLIVWENVELVPG